MDSTLRNKSTTDHYISASDLEGDQHSKQEKNAPQYLFNFKITASVSTPRGHNTMPKTV